MEQTSLEFTILAQPNVSAAFRNFEDARFKYDAACAVVREIIKVMEQIQGKTP